MGNETDRSPTVFMTHVSKSFRRKGEVRAGGERDKTRGVLNGASLEAMKGETVCIIGKNGSGKTTIVRILATLVEPDLGYASVCGFDVVKESREVRRRLGVMLNAGDGGFQPRLSGFTNLEYYAALYRVPLGKARTRITTIMDELGLGDRGSDQYQLYSSGMRRRLALARALISDAPVLLLDEPTLGVDPWSAEQIDEKLRQVAELGKTVICTTNNMAEAENLGGRIYLLENGVLTRSGKVELKTA